MDEKQTYRVIDDAGVVRELVVACRVFDTGPRFTVVTEWAPSYHASARMALMQHSLYERWSVAEILAPGEPSRAELQSAWADGARAMRAAAVAAVKRRAEELDAGVTEEEAADDEEGYGRFQEALELVEVLGALPLPATPAPQSIVWGSMPTAAEVEKRAATVGPPPRDAPWLRRHIDTSGDFVEVLYLRAIEGRTYFRNPSGAVWSLMRGEHAESQWRPLNDDGGVAT